MTDQIANEAGESKAERDPFLKLYTDDWLAGTRALSFEEKGFYIELLCMMWARKSGLPNDVAELARHLRADRRKVRRLLDALVADGKLAIVDNCIVNPRMNRDISRRKVAAKSARSRPEVGPKSRRSLGDFALKSGQLSASDQAKSATCSSTLPPPMEDQPDTRSQIQRKSTDPFSFVTARDEKDDERRVVFSNGKIEIHNGMRAYWLDRFDGDADRLELGLIQAAQFVQPNSSRPLEVQVSSQLARQCAEKADRDKRYAAASAERSRAPPQMSRQMADLLEFKRKAFPEEAMQ